MSQSFYGGYLGNAGALNDLVYRGEPVQLQTLPYYGGGMNVQPLMAGNPSFDLNIRPGALGGRSGEQLKRLYEGGTQQNEKLNEELKNRGIMPGTGPKMFPLAGAAGNMGALFSQLG